MVLAREKYYQYFYKCKKKPQKITVKKIGTEKSIEHFMFFLIYMQMIIKDLTIT